MDLDFFIKKGYKIIKSPENFILSVKGDMIRSPLQINFNGVKIHFENRENWNLQDLESYILRIISRNERNIKIDLIKKREI